jgi:hypothetical protein
MVSAKNAVEMIEGHFELEPCQYEAIGMQIETLLVEGTTCIQLDNMDQLANSEARGILEMLV